MDKNNNLRWFLTTLCLVIFIAICGYVAGKRESDKGRENDQFKVDSLSRALSFEKASYKKLSDSLTENSSQRENKIDMVNEVKRTIRNEIAKTKISIFNLPDSAVQYYVDSVRRSGGFH